MTKDEALKLALEVLEEGVQGTRPLGVATLEALTAIKEALAQPEHEWVRGECVKCGQSMERPEQEPVAWLCMTGQYSKIVRFEWETFGNVTPLYTTPPQRTWVGLTPQERDEINEQVYGAVPHHVAFHAAIEAKLRSKNNV